MAKFHAVPIALRLLQPEIFDKKIRPYLKRTNLYEEIDLNGEITQVSVFIFTNIFLIFHSNFTGKSVCVCVT